MKRVTKTQEHCGPVAVIDVGSSSVRMDIAQQTASEVEILESLNQEVSLGHDVFGVGAIQKQSIEDCVKALTSFRSRLQEYGIDIRNQVKTVATSAVREASNRDAFIDRIYSTTGLDVQVIDNADVSRYLYLSLQPLLATSPIFRQHNCFILEVSGGSTELLFLKNGHVEFSYTYRLGSFRIRDTWARQSTSQIQFVELMKNSIQRTVRQMARFNPSRKRPLMVVLGGDVRFAAKQLLPEWNCQDIAKLPSASLGDFTDMILKKPEDSLIDDFHLSVSQSETLGPALLTYVQLAEALRTTHVYVGSCAMREGILKEMVLGGVWPIGFQREVVHSAIRLGNKFGFDAKHARYIARICDVLYAKLQPLHRLKPKYKLLLKVGSLLHEIGLFVSGRSHHKHSMYLIQNSHLFGLGGQDLLMASLIARYHRKALPKPTHNGYMELDRDNRIAVSKLAAILRIAGAFDISNTQRIKKFDVILKNNQVIIQVSQTVDITLEKTAILSEKELFMRVFGINIMFRRVE